MSQRDYPQAEFSQENIYKKKKTFVQEFELIENYLFFGYHIFAYAM